MKHPPVTERKLGKHKADGLYWPDTKSIEIDPNLKPKRKMEVMIHELLHHRHPDWTEEKVNAEGLYICEFLWKHNYRKVSQ